MAASIDGRCFCSLPGRLIAVTCLDRLLDFFFDVSQVEERGRLHRRKLDGSFPELGHNVLDQDEPPGFAAHELV